MRLHWWTQAPQRGLRMNKPLHAHALQLLIAPRFVLAALGEGHCQQGAIGSLFMSAGRLAQA